MNISTKNMAIAVAAILLCILATLFWPGSTRQKQKDDTIGASVLLPVNEDQPPVAAKPPVAEPSSQSTAHSVIEPPQERPQPTIVTTEDGAYTVQVSSWRSRWKAELDMNRYLDQGFAAYIQRVYLPEKGGIWHRVRIGRFDSAELAAQQADAIHELLQDGFWIATR